jgi:predicted AAA+ superfamily ATPase
MDDLSFEEFEIEYKYLKAVIEGGLETEPENI